MCETLVREVFKQKVIEKGGGVIAANEYVDTIEKNNKCFLDRSKLFGYDEIYLAAYEKEYIKYLEKNLERSKALEGTTAEYIEKIEGEISSGHRVIIIAHSQGNLFANSALRQIYKEHPDWENYIGLINVATPSSLEGPGQSVHIRSTDDRVINPLGNYGFALKGSINNDPSILFFVDDREWKNHGFVTAYFGENLKSRDLIDEHIESFMDSLEFLDADDIFSIDHLTFPESTVLVSSKNDFSDQLSVFWRGQPAYPLTLYLDAVSYRDGLNFPSHEKIIYESQYNSFSFPWGCVDGGGSGEAETIGYAVTLEDGNGISTPIEQFLFTCVFSLIVSDDIDKDGILDDWEVSFGLDPNDKSDAQENPDNDKCTNLEEYLDANNPLSASTDDDLGYCDSRIWHKPFQLIDSGTDLPVSADVTVDRVESWFNWVIQKSEITTNDEGVLRARFVVDDSVDIENDAAEVEFTLSIDKEGYQPHSETLLLDLKDETRPYNVTYIYLDPINATPSKERIYIDGGIAPYMEAPLCVSEGVVGKSFGVFKIKEGQRPEESELLTGLDVGQDVSVSIKDTSVATIPSRVSDDGVTFTWAEIKPKGVGRTMINVSYKGLEASTEVLVYPENSEFRELYKDGCRFIYKYSDGACAFAEGAGYAKLQIFGLEPFVEIDGCQIVSNSANVPVVNLGAR